MGYIADGKVEGSKAVRKYTFDAVGCKENPHGRESTHPVYSPGGEYKKGGDVFGVLSST